MKIKYYIGIFAGLFSGLYLAALSKDPSSFVIYLGFAYIAGAILFFFFATDLVSKLLPETIWRLHQERKLRFRFIVLLFPVILFLGISLSRELFPVTVPAYLKIVAFVGIFLFSLFLTWSLLRMKRARVFVIASTCFILFFIILVGWTFTFARSSSESSLEEIVALPYLTWVSAETKDSGVTIRDPKQAYSGVNLYNPRHLSEAFLIDMKGKVLHKWSHKIAADDSWHHIELGQNGDLLCIVNDRYLMKLGCDSKLKWQQKGRFHHDVRYAPNSDIYALSRNDSIVFVKGIPLPILNDRLVIFSADGTVKNNLQLFEAYKQEITYNEIFTIYRWILQPKNLYKVSVAALNHLLNPDSDVFEEGDPLDLFHTNSVQWIDRTVTGVARKGDYLVSPLGLNLIGVLDPQTKSLRWKWGKERLSRAHHPTLLENGNILVFDNGIKSRSSRILEIAPQSGEIVWEYKSGSGHFFSRSRGASQRLPNGNTLITESDRGHVFEVTKAGTVVWEFFVPYMSEDKRAAVYRMIRFTDEFTNSCVTQTNRR